jgi:hypothetical protein
VCLYLSSNLKTQRNGQYKYKNRGSTYTTMSRDDHNRKVTTRKHRTDVGNYSFVNRTVRSWNQLPAVLLASFPCKINTFRKRVKNVVTSKGIQVRMECK